MRPGASFNLQDWIPARLDAPLRKRGGWSYQSTAMGSSTFVDVLVHAPFAAATKLLAIGSDSNLYDNTSGTPSSLGATVAGLQNPTFFNNSIQMFAIDGTTAPKTYDTTNGLIAMGGSPPTARYSCVFKGRLAASNTNAAPTAVYFAPPGWGPSGAGGSWDTTNAQTPTSQPVNGLAATANSILVFHDSLVERLRGNIPFGTTNSDMVLEALWGGIGCADARSIVTWNEQVLWADARGVYQSDGAAVRDLTTLTGMKSLWQASLSGYVKPTSASTGYRIAGGLYRDHLIMSVTNQSGSTPFVVETFVFDLANQIAWRFQNFPVRAFARAQGSTDEAYMALAHQGRTATMSSCWAPAAANKNDADGTAVLPVWESTFFRGYQRYNRRWIQSMGLQRWHYLYPSYECVDAGSDGPFLTMSIGTTPDKGSVYPVTLTPTLGTTTGYMRMRIPVRLPANGLTVRIAQTNASADTRLYGLEADYAPVEGSRLQ
jgi:hypothetical protein